MAGNKAVYYAQESIKRLKGVDAWSIIRIKNPQGFYIYCVKPKGFQRIAVGPDSADSGGITPWAVWHDTLDGDTIDHCPYEFGFTLEQPPTSTEGTKP